MPQRPDPARPPGPGAAFYRALLEGHTDVLLVLADDGTIRYATPSAITLFGRQEVAGRRLPDLVGAAALPQVADAVRRMLAAGPGAGAGEDSWLITAGDGREVHVQVSVSDLRENPSVGGVLLTLRDMTSQRETEAELRKLAYHDQLTGLPNRALFAARAARAVARAVPAGLTAAVMFVDLDDFKGVNDSRGHRTGDEVLAITATRLAGAIRSQDTAARIGGDEFAVLLEDLQGPADAAAFADRAVRSLGQPFAVEGGQIIVGASIGLATTADARDPADLMRRADLALYAAKARGKGTWIAYDPATTGRMPPPPDSRDWASQLSEMSFTGTWSPETPRRSSGRPGRQRAGLPDGREPPRAGP